MYDLNDIISYVSSPRRECRSCGSEMVVRLPPNNPGEQYAYERCMSCHACFANGKPIGETPRNFRITSEDQIKNEMTANALMLGGKNGRRKRD